MGVINPITLATIITAYVIVSIVSGISILSTELVGPSNLINNSFSPEVTTVDTDLLQSDNAFEALKEIPSTSSNNFNLMVRAMTMQAPFWEHGWASIGRLILGGIFAAYLIVLGFFGLSLLLRALGR